MSSVIPGNSIFPFYCHQGHLQDQWKQSPKGLVSFEWFTFQGQGRKTFVWHRCIGHKWWICQPCDYRSLQDKLHNKNQEFSQRYSKLQLCCKPDFFHPIQHDTKTLILLCEEFFQFCCTSISVFELDVWEQFSLFELFEQHNKFFIRSLWFYSKCWMEIGSLWSNKIDFASVFCSSKIKHSLISASQISDICLLRFVTFCYDPLTGMVTMMLWDMILLSEEIPISTIVFLWNQLFCWVSWLYLCFWCLTQLKTDSNMVTQKDFLISHLFQMFHKSLNKNNG